jgi:glycosyltransferase involved in cell wall biosynthesis
VKSPAALLGIPGQLWSLWRDVRERRQSRDRLMTHLDPVAALQSDAVTPARPAVSATLSAVPQSAAVKPAGRLATAVATSTAGGLAGLDVETLKARVEADGLAPVKAMLLGAGGQVDAKALAFRMLQVGKALSDAGRRDDEFELAEAALGVDGSDQTLRGFFWAAQRSRRFEQACRTIHQLERLYGDTPTPDQQAILAKLRVSPAFQLSVLDLVSTTPRERLEGVAGRICYVLHNSLPYSSGGYGTRSHGVAGGLKAAGREVIVLTRPGFPVDIKTELNDADVPAEDVIDGIRYVRTLEPKRKGMSMLQYVTKAADALERQMRAVRPEMVMSASNHVTALPALIAARRLGLPFIYEVRGLWEITRISREQEFEDTPAFAVQSLLEAKVAQLADHVFTLTEPMREELSSRGVRDERIELLPNSCDPERFLPRPRDQALAARLGIPEGVPVIGYVGTFVDYEGLEDLALACTLLKQRGVNFRLMLVGNENASGTDRGPITEQILRIAEAEGMTDWLIMPGRVPHEEVESYYSLIDIAPFPRKPWPVCEMVSPMKPLEALAMEKAVLVSSVRALTEMIADGQTGRVFDKGSVASLADRLQELIAAPQQRLDLGRRGRIWVGAERTWKQIGIRAARRFDQVLAAHRERRATEVA